MRSELYLVLLFSFYQTVQAQPEWKLAKQKGTIKVYTKDVGNRGIKELKTIATFNGVNLHQIFAVFKDVPSAAQWSANCKFGKSVKINTVTDYYNYFQIGAPWPIKNRDVIYHSQVHYDAKDSTLYIQAMAEPDLLPENPNHVRIRESYGYWKIKWHHSGVILVENQLFADPIGFPAWLVNFFAVDGPITTVSNLENQAKKEKYKDAYYSFISDGKNTEATGKNH